LMKMKASRTGKGPPKTAAEAAVKAGPEVRPPLRTETLRTKARCGPETRCSSKTWRAVEPA
jgi:hypothetical protein